MKRLLERPDGQRRFGPFVLVRPLGRGGNAPVWLAKEVYGATEIRTAAIKLFSIEPGGHNGPSSAAARYREKVIAEARALSLVEHPHIVRYYNLHVDEARGVWG